jgi:hypothetical protein
LLSGALVLGQAPGEEGLHVGGGKGNVWFPAGCGCPLERRHQVMHDGGQNVRDRRIRISQACAERLQHHMDIAQRADGIDGGSRNPGAEIFLLTRGEAGAGYPKDGGMQQVGQDLLIRGLQVAA